MSLFIMAKYKQSFEKDWLYGTPKQVYMPNSLTKYCKKCRKKYALKFEIPFLLISFYYF